MTQNRFAKAKSAVWRMSIIGLAAFYQLASPALALAQPQRPQTVPGQTTATESEGRELLNQQVKAQLGDRFAGIIQEGNTTVVRFKGSVSDQERHQLEDLRKKKAEQISLSFRAAQNSRTELSTMLDSLSHDVAKLNHELAITMIGVDEANNELVVGVDDNNTQRVQATLATRYPNTPLRVETQEPLTPGSRTYSPGTFKAGLRIDIGRVATCTSGFNMRDRNNYRRAISAGHCIKKGSYIEHNRISVGLPTIWQYGEDMDAGLFSLNPTSSPWLQEDSTLVPIYGARTASKNEPACFSGLTSGKRCGSVYLTDTTFVNTEGVTQRHMDCLNVGMQGGDSGAPVYFGSTGFGIVSSGNASRTCYTPLPRIMDRWGLRLVGNEPKVISPRQSGKCLDVDLGNWGNGSRVQQWTCWNGDNQVFFIEPMYLGNSQWSDEWSQMRAFFSGRCLDFHGGQSYNGGLVQQWDCWGGEMQQFRFVAEPGTTSPEYGLQNRYNYRCLDINDYPDPYRDGNIAQQWDCWLTDQTFRLFERNGF